MSIVGTIGTASQMTTGALNIPCTIHDDDEDTLLPKLPDTGTMGAAYQLAYVVPVYDVGDLCDNPAVYCPPLTCCGKPKDCNDGNVCTYDRCGSVTGGCYYTPRCSDDRLCCPADSSYFCCKAGEEVCCPRNPAYADHCCDSGKTCCGAECCLPEQTCCNGHCGLKGACCFFDAGSCSQLTEVCCAQQGGTYRGDGTTCTAGDLCMPKCDNCHTVTDTLYECHHWETDPNGASCSMVECIKNVLDTATCDFHPARITPSDCGSHSATGGILVQTVHANSCAGGTVLWTPWHTIYYNDCSSECFDAPIEMACTTGACPGVQTQGPFDRGTKKVCGCP